MQHDKEYQKEAGALLEELNYLLSWMIHSLTVSVREREAKLTRSSKRKKRTSVSEPSEAEISNMQTAASLWNLFTLYIYEHMALIQVCTIIYGPCLSVSIVILKESNFERKSLLHLLQGFDVPANLLASTLVAMEITVSCLMKLGDYSNELVEKVEYLASTNYRYRKLVCVCSFRL